MTERVPTSITLHQKSKVMEIAFADGRSFRLPSGEYELHCEIRERGGASHHSTHTVVTPADGVVQVSLIEHALREQPVMKLASGAAVARAQ